MRPIHEIRDVHNCPRCGKSGLFPEGEMGGGEGPRWSCRSCNGWWSAIELKMLPRVPSASDGLREDT